jgi:hypothetical protein
MHPLVSTRGRAAAAAACVVTLLLGACAKDPSEVGADNLPSADAAPACPVADGGTAASPPAVDGGSTLNCNASCNFTGGISVECATRFQYGVNYAWNHFGYDFGGGGPSGGGGVSRDCMGKVAGDLADMRANGVDVVRWWVWPRFGTGVVFDATGTAQGLGGTTLDDVEAALMLAAANDLHIQFCLFSFDNFKPTNGANRSLQPIITDPTKRAALIEQAVRPFVRAANVSPYWDRVISWDVINEPEWAITGQDPYGDPAFTPQTTLQLVAHADMEAFVGGVIAGIQAESPLPITVGSAGAVWPRAWSNVPLDFYTIHIYDWLNANYPYSRSPAALGYSGKPLVVGEFPLGGLANATVPYAQLLASWFSNGYAGAMGWSVTDTNFNWPANKSNVKAFADGAGCATHF